MEQALVIIEDETSYLADSRQIAKQLGINHNDFFNNLIKKYQSEIEKDFGLVRFQNVKTTGDKRGRGRPSSYALLTEDQAYVYLAYSKNTEQARRCKRNLVKAFSMAREIILTLTSCPEADLDGLSPRQVRMVGLIGQAIDARQEGQPYDHFWNQFIKEAQEMTPEEHTWQPFPQPVKLLR